MSNLNIFIRKIYLIASIIAIFLTTTILVFTSANNDQNIELEDLNSKGVELVDYSITEAEVQYDLKVPTYSVMHDPIASFEKPEEISQSSTTLKDRINEWNQRQNEILFGKKSEEEFIILEHQIISSNSIIKKYLSFNVQNHAENTNGKTLNVRQFVPVSSHEVDESLLQNAESLSGLVTKGSIWFDEKQGVYRLLESSSSGYPFLKRFREHNLDRYPDSPSLYPVASDYLIEEWPEGGNSISNNLEYIFNITPTASIPMRVSITIQRGSDQKIKVFVSSKGIATIKSTEFNLTRELYEIINSKDQSLESMSFEEQIITKNRRNGQTLELKEVLEMN